MIVALRIIRNWLVPPMWREGPIYRAEAVWVETFDAETARHGPLALEQARINYEFVARGFEGLDAKAAELLRTAGTLATILVVAVANLGLVPGIFLKASLVCLLAAIAAAINGRRAMLKPSPPSVRVLMEPLGDPAHLEKGEFSEVPNAEAWLAASIERASIAYRDLEEWKARNLLIASALVGIAMLLLLPSIVWI